MLLKALAEREGSERQLPARFERDAIPLLDRLFQRRAGRSPPGYIEGAKGCGPIYS
jgi:hypothetical protein